MLPNPNPDLRPRPRPKEVVQKSRGAEGLVSSIPELRVTGRAGYGGELAQPKQITGHIHMYRTGIQDAGSRARRVTSRSSQIPEQNLPPFSRLGDSKFDT